MFFIEFYWLFLFLCLIISVIKKMDIWVYLLFLFYNIIFITIIKFNYIDLDVQFIVQGISDVFILWIICYLLPNKKTILKFFSIWIIFFITNFQIIFIEYQDLQEILFQIDNYNLDYLCLFIVAVILKQKEKLIS